MRELLEPPLRAACHELVKETLWQTPNPLSIRDIVDEEQINCTSEGYLRLAKIEATCLAAHGLDPNIITRIVQFLAREYAISSMKDDLIWFGWTINALVSLLVAIHGASSDSLSLLRDLEDIARARQGVANGSLGSWKKTNTDGQNRPGRSQ